MLICICCDIFSCAINVHLCTVHEKVMLSRFKNFLFQPSCQGLRFKLMENGKWRYIISSAICFWCHVHDAIVLSVLALGPEYLLIIIYVSVTDLLVKSDHELSKPGGNGEMCPASRKVIGGTVGQPWTKILFFSVDCLI